MRSFVVDCILAVDCVLACNRFVLSYKKYVFFLWILETVFLIQSLRAFRKPHVADSNVLEVFLLCCSLLGNFGAILGPSCGVLGDLGAVLWHLGPSCGHLGAILRPSWSILGYLGAILGLSWTILGPFWAMLGPFGAILAPPWGHLGPERRPEWLGSMRLGILATKMDPKTAPPKNLKSACSFSILLQSPMWLCLLLSFSLFVNFALFRISAPRPDSDDHTGVGSPR